jgi:hypothetical protein
MKTTLLFGVCIMLGMTGCQKSIEADDADMKAAAFASIAAEHPDLDASELQFSDIIRSEAPGGEELICVGYTLPASAQTVISNTPQGKMSIVTTKAINVMMSSSGAAKSVHEGTVTHTYSIDE